MTLHILMLKDGAFPATEIHSAVVIPVNATRFMPLLPSGEKLFDFAGREKLENEILEANGGENQAILLSGHDLKKHNLKYVIVKIINFQSAKNSNEVKLELSHYYQKTLEKVVEKGIKCVTIPFIKYQSSNVSLEEVMTHSLLEIQKWTVEHPEIKTHFIVEDDISFKTLMKIKHLLLINAEITAPKDLLDKNKFGSIFSMPLEDSSEDSLVEEEKGFDHRREKTLSGLRHANTRTYSPNRFEPEPHSPIELKGKLFNGKQQPPETPFTSAHLKKWESISNKAIVNLKQEVVLDLDKLKFFLGPAIYPLRCHYEKGGLKELEWRLNKLNCKKFYLTQALYGIEIYCKYLEHTRLFLVNPDEFGKTTQKFKDKFEALHHVHADKMEEGLISYKSWITKEQAVFFGNEFSSKWRQIKKSDSYKMDEETKEKLQIALIEYVNIGLERTVYASSLLDPKTIEMLKNLFNQLKINLLKIMEKEDDLEQLVKFIKQEISRLSDEIKVLSGELEKLNKILAAAIIVETSEYQKFAEKWLSNEDNYVSVYDEMLLNDENEWVGLTKEQLVTLIVRFNSNETLARQTNAIKSFYKREKEIDIYQQRFQSQLRKHYIDTEFEPLIMASRLFHKIVEKQKTAVILSIDDGEKAALSAIADNTSMLLRSVLQSPLEWHQLTQVLDCVACKSEAQQSLKMKLQSFIDYRDPGSTYNYLNTLLFSSEELLERRRQVNYLVSCLYLASALQRDDGILFKLHRDGADGACVGVDLILNNFKKDNIKSSLLKNLLEAFLNEINTKSVLYLPQQAGDLLDPLQNSQMTIDDIVKKSAEKLPIVLQWHDVGSIEQQRSADLLNVLGFYRSPQSSVLLPINDNCESHQKIKIVQGR
ncbi:MAG: hypothetical protein P4M14_04985 [Gammaproteobacteria bacterium]|nr:hypothetical protein [Gammaproteobacteria bacterium]